MRQIPLTSAFMFLALMGCQYDSDLSEDELGKVELASVGGVAANGSAHYDAVAAITILRPPPLDGTTRDTRRCSGVLVEDRTVLTSANCLSANVEAEIDPQRVNPNFLDPLSVIIQFGPSVTGTMEYSLDATFDEGPNTHKGVTLHRYYEFGGRGINDIALLRLSASPGISPVAIHTGDLPSSLVGMPLELLGYGKDDESATTELFAVRTVVDPDILALNFSDIVAGDEDKNTCYADSGGPGFLEFGNGPEVVSVTGAAGRNDKCDKVVNRQRVDRYTERFLTPFLTRFSNPCVGAACDACDYDGVCEEDCPTRDWDCELGSFAGEACDTDGQCEQGGHCIAATDDPTFTYCAIPCDLANALGCPNTMVCGSGNECIYDGISPGSQGAGCTTTDDCRSGFCESLFCANECDVGDANACDTEGGFLCLPATDNGSVNVCRLNVDTGGGGFCGVSGSASNTRTTFLTCFGFLFLVGMIRRRRQRQY